jgi:hypothetical protein
MRRSGEEPEPIDLTHLNIEASMMCLASKVRQAHRKSFVMPLHIFSSDPDRFRYPGPHLGLLIRMDLMRIRIRIQHLQLEIFIYIFLIKNCNLLIPRPL